MSAVPRREAAQSGFADGVLRLSAAIWLCLLLALPCARAYGLNRERTITQFHHTSWSAEDGAPADIWALAQSVDGYLWLGTGGGLYRFDGVRFERVEPPTDRPFRSHNITALTALPSGELWMGFYTGGVSVLRDGRFTHYGERDGLPAGTISRLVQDTEGAMWAATGTGLARFASGRWQRIGAEWSFSGQRVDWIVVDRDGTLWVGDREQLWFLRKGQRRFETAGEPLGMSVFATAPDGTLWISDAIAGLRTLSVPASGSAVRRVPREVPEAARVEVKRMIFDRDGGLWATDALRGGVFRIAFPERIAARVDGSRAPQRSDITEVFTQTNGLTADIAVPVLEDREGNIWIGTNLGLNRFRRSHAVAEIAIPATSPFGFALAAGNDRSVWVANPGALWRIDEDAPRRVVSPLPRIDCIAQGPNGVLWLGGSNLWRLQEERLVAVDLPAGNRSPVRALAIDQHGAPWISLDGARLLHLEDGQWVDHQPRLDSSAAAATAMSSDAAGNMWFGYPDSTVARLSDGRMQVFSTGQGLNVGKVQVVHAGLQHVLIGGELGLARFDAGGFRSLTAARLPVLTGISGIIETSNGDAWVNGSRGVVYMRAAELLRALQESDYLPQYELFDFQDGLPGIAQQEPVPAAVLGHGDRIWLATNHGVAWMDPSRIRRNELVPPVLIQAVIVDGHRHEATASLQLPQRTTSLRIDYTANSLSVPERVRFRYRLDGVDAQWQDPGSRREAFYTNLGPGSYRFHVVASNNDGVWNEQGATLDFRIAPTFYQTGWFVALCAIAAAGFLWLLFILRLRQVTARMRERLHERLIERERIARELHDTLLQGLQGLILRLHAANEHIPQGAKPREMIEHALNRADQVLIEGRDRIRDLRTTTAASGDLGREFVAAAEELKQHHPAEFRFIAQGPERELDPIVREEVSRIGREALSNAFRHAGAAHIELEMVHHRREFVLSIRDDGRGIDEQVLRTGHRQNHWGLTGMRERAAKIRGRLTVWSRAGMGTEVELRVPGAMAYVTAGRLRAMTTVSSAAQAMPAASTNKPGE